MDKREPTQREIKSQEIRETIFQVSMDLFRKYGYNRVTMKMISKESGISEGSIFHFFGEKTGILSMLHPQIQKSIHHLIEPTEEHIADPYHTLLEYLTAQTAGYEKLGRELARAYYGVPQKSISEKRVNNLISIVNNIEPELMKFIEIAMNRGTINTSLSAEELAYVLIVIGSGTTSTWLSYGEGHSLSETSRKMFDITLKAYLNM